MTEKERIEQRKHLHFYGTVDVNAISVSEAGIYKIDERGYKQEDGVILEGPAWIVCDRIPKDGNVNYYLRDYARIEKGLNDKDPFGNGPQDTRVSYNTDLYYMDNESGKVKRNGRIGDYCKRKGLECIHMPAMYRPLFSPDYMYIDAFHVSGTNWYAMKRDEYERLMQNSFSNLFKSPELLEKYIDTHNIEDICDAYDYTGNTLDKKTIEKHNLGELVRAYFTDNFMYFHSNIHKCLSPEYVAENFIEAYNDKKVNDKYVARVGVYLDKNNVEEFAKIVKENLGDEINLSSNKIETNSQDILEFFEGMKEHYNIRKILEASKNPEEMKMLTISYKYVNETYQEIKISTIKEISNDYFKTVEAAKNISEIAEKYSEKIRDDFGTDTIKDVRSVNLGNLQKFNDAIDGLLKNGEGNSKELIKLKDCLTMKTVSDFFNSKKLGYEFKKGFTCLAGQRDEWNKIENKVIDSLIEIGSEDSLKLLKDIDNLVNVKEENKEKIKNFEIQINREDSRGYTGED